MSFYLASTLVMSVYSETEKIALKTIIKFLKSLNVIVNTLIHVLFILQYKLEPILIVIRVSYISNFNEIGLHLIIN